MSHSSWLQRIRPAGVRSVRLTTGLVLFTYVGTHLLNHSPGNISLAWLERDLLVQKFIWQGWLGTAVLYSALATPPAAHTQRVVSLDTPEPVACVYACVDATICQMVHRWHAQGCRRSTYRPKHDIFI
ncbi:hypothetical protein [Burkholderia sp. Nafp2/4-1b]|uniref:hypothetical protein n=1 Tax=Burkholderia sp. Nafp2/4-1b TaxID=2116686 RepID=UPI001F090531|nr:hypothetical protein [Burkholderia sp. Nafp2/4-1b]